MILCDPACQMSCSLQAIFCAGTGVLLHRSARDAVEAAHLPAELPCQRPAGLCGRGRLPASELAHCTCDLDIKSAAVTYHSSIQTDIGHHGRAYAGLDCLIQLDCCAMRRPRMWRHGRGYRRACRWRWARRLHGCARRRSGWWSLSGCRARPASGRCPNPSWTPWPGG